MNLDMKTVKFENNYAVLNTKSNKYMYKGSLLDCYAYIEVCKRFI